MAQDVTMLVVCIGIIYGGIIMMITLFSYLRMYRLYIQYRRLLTTKIHVEAIPPASLLDTQELKPVLRKIISTEVTLYIQPDAELEARVKAQIHQHKRNLKRIIDHISSDQLAS